MSTKAIKNPYRGGSSLHRLAVDILKNKWLYIMLIPGVIYFLVFKYLPMWGIIIAFENYTPFKGPLKSEWRGLYWFQRFFSTISGSISSTRDSTILSLSSNASAINTSP